MQQPWPPSDAGPGWTVGRVRSHSLISSEVRLWLLIGGTAVFGSFLVWNENFKRPRALSGSSAYKDNCRSNNALVELWIFLSISFKNMMLYDFSTGICRKGALMSSAVVTLMRVRKADSCFLIKHNRACWRDSSAQPKSIFLQLDCENWLQVAARNFTASLMCDWFSVNKGAVYSFILKIVQIKCSPRLSLNK